MGDLQAALIFRPQCLRLNPLPCVVGPLIVFSAASTGRSRTMYESGAHEAALRLDLCRVQHRLDDDILTDQETADLQSVHQWGWAQLEAFQQRDSPRRFSQRLKL